MNIIHKLEANDIYDFVFLTVKSNQAHTALEELKNNNSPIADAYYEANVPEKAGEGKELMRKTAVTIKKNLDSLRKLGVTLTPKKMKVLHRLPVQILSIGLRFAFQSEFGNTFMYQHSMKALDEMREFHNQFYSYIGSGEDRN